MILVWRTPVLQGRGIAPKCRPPEVFPFIKSLHNREKTLFARQMLDAVFVIPQPSPPGGSRHHRRYGHHRPEPRYPGRQLRKPPLSALRRREERTVPHPATSSTGSRIRIFGYLATRSGMKADTRGFCRRAPCQRSGVAIFRDAIRITPKIASPPFSSLSSLSPGR